MKISPEDQADSTPASSYGNRMIAPRKGETVIQRMATQIYAGMLSNPTHKGGAKEAVGYAHELIDALNADFERRNPSK